MPRALLLGMPLHGHINPTLPLVEQLVGRGHDVVYYATPPFAAAIEATGASYRPYRNAHLTHTAAIPEQLDRLAYLLTRTASEVMEDELGDMRAVGADYVITDATAPWGHWVAEALNLPVLTSVTTFAFNRQVLRYGLERGVRPKSVRVFVSKLRYLAKVLALQRAMRRRHGLKGPSAVTAFFGRSDLNIIYTSRMFQPCAETFDSRFHFVGPMMARRESVAFSLPPDGRPLVYVSFGTLFHDNPAFYQTCFEAFRDEPYRVLVSAGQAATDGRLGPPPANVRVEARVPQLQVLQHAAASVSHGGMNSTSESLYFGVPLVIIPQMSEQFIVGRRVEELGAGVFIAKQPVSADELRTAVRRVLSTDRYRLAAQAIGGSFRAAGGAAEAADVIDRYVSARHR
jgi:MGT family glycosyltransferase